MEVKQSIEQIARVQESVVRVEGRLKRESAECSDKQENGGLLQLSKSDTAGTRMNIKPPSGPDGLPRGSLSGDRDIKTVRGGTDRDGATHVRNIVQERIETQVESNIPQPKVTAM